jgi:hypothetical protein
MWPMCVHDCCGQWAGSPATSTEACKPADAEVIASLLMILPSSVLWCAVPCFFYRECKFSGVLSTASLCITIGMHGMLQVGADARLVCAHMWEACGACSWWTWKEQPMAVHLRCWAVCNCRWHCCWYRHCTGYEAMAIADTSNLGLLYVQLQSRHHMRCTFVARVGAQCCPLCFQTQGPACIPVCQLFTDVPIS